MNPSRAPAVWHLQLRRRFRLRSVAFSVFEIAIWALWFVTILTSTFVVFSVMSDTMSLDALGVDIREWMQTYGFLLALAVLFTNMWLSAQSGSDYSAYKFIPLSLRSIGIAIQLGSAIRIRYLAMFLLICVTYELALDDLSGLHVGIALVTIVVIDELVVALRLAVARRPSLVYALSGLLCGLGGLEIIHSRAVSKALAAAFLNLGTMNLLMTGLIACLLLAVTHKLIVDDLRYVG